MNNESSSKLIRISLDEVLYKCYEKVSKCYFEKNF